MSAPHVPHLSTFRSARGRGSGRGRGPGRGGLADGVDEVDNVEARDKIVKQTDQDASVSRMSAVALGYLDDPFARAFAPEPASRRYPIINRGTYVRTAAIDSLVDRFLSVEPSQPKQIVSLGAGSDTRYFRLISKNPSLRLVYHELDFPSNTAAKIAVIQRNPSLLETLRSFSQSDVIISAESTSMISSNYNIHPLDLRVLASASSALSSSPPALPNLSAIMPTLLLSEMCLIYLSPLEADSALRAFASSLIPAPTPLALVLYEPILPHDPFGKVMVSNLARRGIQLKTLDKYGSLMRQRQRLKATGFKELDGGRGGQGVADIDFIWERWIDEAEKERIAGLEMLDELEEWKLLAQHYCIAWGWRGDAFADAWKDVDGQQDENDGDFRDH